MVLPFFCPSYVFLWAVLYVYSMKEKVVECILLWGIWLKVVEYILCRASGFILSFSAV